MDSDYKFEIPIISMDDYDYCLPDERIAKYPLPCRDASKLLVYRKGECSEKVFRNIADELPEDSIMVFNNTKVVPARLHFRRSSGAHIEIFCLKPEAPSEYVSAFAATSRCSWKCVVGNIKRWKDDILEYDTDDEELKSINLNASLIKREEETCIVEFSWTGGRIFSDVLDLCGKVPIPPYLNRETQSIDIERYQTLYAQEKGSVAAPTAGLHFTESVLSDIRSKGIDIENVCLHVGAGTFLPVKTSDISGHVMHREPVIVKRSFLDDLLSSSRRIVTAVGTTSVRTLESLYYLGVSCIEEGHPSDVSQWAPYIRDYAYSLEESLKAIVDWMDRNSRDEVKFETRIIIVPGFRFRIVDRLVTNFHQPKSTLILLISAFVGGDWRTIYDFAMSNGFRFLSYGDSSLLIRR